jgi:NADPH-dependent 2,4-dienoyl-CoA reductase/sulfur reductase-like enzyme/nitrite reductase/ring-hydroxylating ferredoxin subunit
VPATGVLAGHVDGKPVLLARLHDGIHAVSGACTHYGGPLAEGLVVGEEVRCPWHHACFSLRTGEALRAPAFARLGIWKVEVVGDRVFVRGEDTAPSPEAPRRARDPERIVIVGGGTAGYAAAERLRTLGFAGSLTMLCADADAPYDRPNLSKDYLAGTAPEDWIPLQGPDFYTGRGIDLRLACEVAAIDTSAREVRTAGGEHFGYDALLIATGAEPRRLTLPGFDRREVFVLRSLADARALIAATTGASSIALIGAGFIGLEAAAALRARGLDVHVIAPDAVPMDKVLGRELGGLLVDLHRANGVQFHLGVKPVAYDGKAVTLGDGTRVAADRVLLGIGVTPRTVLAEAAGFAVDNGILVDACLQTSVPGHYAAGDVARYLHGTERVRVEHWVHAQRMGQAAAANLLGAAQPFKDVPFFWTHQYDVELRWSGVGAGWDEVRVDGDLAKRDATLRYFREGKLVAAATLGRDLECLAIEAELAGA